MRSEHSLRTSKDCGVYHGMRSINAGCLTKFYRKACFNRRRLAMSVIIGTGSRGTKSVADFDQDVCVCAVKSRSTTTETNGIETGRLREKQTNVIHSIVANIQHSEEELWNNDAILFDSHCHLQLEPLYANANEVTTLAVRLGVKHMVVCGTEPGADWQKVLALSEAHPSVVMPSFGLHPWWIQQYYSPPFIDSFLGDEHSGAWDHSVWLPELEAFLQQHPLAGVGEAGLDRGIVKAVPYVLQEAVLLAHVRLAGKYQRALTLHCVGCWDRLLGLLRQYHKECKQQHPKDKLIAGNSMSADDQDTPLTSSYFPASIVLHSCASMPIHLTQSFARLPNTFFSLSMGARSNTGELNEKMKSFVRAIPTDRMLLETDSPDQLPAPFKLPRASTKESEPTTVDSEPPESGYCTPLDSFLQYNEPALLRYHCVQVARALGITPRHLAQQTTANSMKAFNIACPS